MILRVLDATFGTDFPSPNGSKITLVDIKAMPPGMQEAVLQFCEKKISEAQEARLKLDEDFADCVKVRDWLNSELGIYRGTRCFEDETPSTKIVSPPRQSHARQFDKS